MRFNYRWFCELLGESLPLDEVCLLLTGGGIEVEEVIDLGAKSGTIVVGELRAIDPHPNADKLRLATVALGEGPDAPTQQVVCGAPNLRVGARYPFAKLGAVLPDGMELKAAKIRGVVSQGMICSAAELQWSEESDGVLELPDSYKPGEPFDAIIDTKVTPDRPDCLSVFGLARDVAGLRGRRLDYPEPKLAESGVDSSSRATVEVADFAGCARYMARVVEGVEIKESPLWMRRRLEVAGVRPINNIVDATNYVLLETGHPLHGFDLDRLAGAKVVARRAAPGEKMKLLDDSEIALDPSDLVIADAERPQVLAGVMGGEDSEVSESTKNVLIECARFDPSSIRKSSRRHAKKSESSYRFERGVCHDDMPVAIARAAQLMAEMGGGTILRGAINVAAPAPAPHRIEIGVERCNRFLGSAIEQARMERALDSLGFKVFDQGEGRFAVAPPSFRLDVSMDADVFEEIARWVGYDNIPATMPRLDVAEVEEYALLPAENLARQTMAGLGFDEAMTYSFVDPKKLEPFISSPEAAAALMLENPISPELAMMRPCLFPSLLISASLNQRRQERDIALFEVANVFFPILGGFAKPGEAPRSKELIQQEAHVCAVLGGNVDAHWRNSGKGRAVDFFDLKGAAETLLTALGAELRFEHDHGDTKWLHPGRAGCWKNAQGETILRAGQLHPDLKKLFDLRDEKLYLFEGNLRMIVAAGLGTKRHQTLSHFPAVGRDIALVVDAEAAAGDLFAVIRSAGGEQLEDARLMDVYAGGQVPQGKKSLAFALTFRAPDRSLTDDEVNSAVERVVAKAGKLVGASLRA